MITETTAISCAAFGALSTGLGIAAGLGWIRCARMLAKAQADADFWQDRHEFYGTWAAESAQDSADYLTRSKAAEAERDKAKLRAEQYASSWGRVMRLLRIAEGELKTLRTAQLRQEQAERMDAAADRIAA